MKLLVHVTLLISFFVLSPAIFAQDTLPSSETRQLINSLKNNVDLSYEEKITAYKSLLEKERAENDLNSVIVLVLNQALLSEMARIASYVDVKAIFETLIPLEKKNKTNENINLYIRLLSTASNSYLNLKEYNSAKKLISEMQSYLPIYDITEVNKAYVFMAAGQLYVMTGEYKAGLTMLRLAMNAYENSASLNKIDKSKKISFVLSYIGNTFYTLGDYKNAIKFYDKSNEAAGSTSSLNVTVAYNHNIASSQLELAEWKQALSTATTASYQAKSIDSDVYFALSNEIIARAEHGLGRSEKAIETIRLSIDTYKKINYTQKIIEALAYEAEFHINLGNWEQARKNTIEAYSLLENSKQKAKSTIELFKSSFLIEESNNDFEKALFYHKQLTELKEADFEIKKNQDAQRLMLDFELDLAEEKSLRLEQENELKSILIERNQSHNRFLMTVISGTIALLVLLIYVYMRERSLKMKMSHLAMTDHLTGCPNRRNAIFRAKDMLRNQVNKKDSASIAILDVDNFKVINDTYGHDVGDKVLQNLSSIIMGELRETDVIGRYGGEEFIILLPHADEEEIKMIFSRIQTALKNHTCDCNGEYIALPITVSMGASIVTNVPEQLDERGQNSLLDMIIKEADEKAYEAKEEGKDQLRIVTVSFDN